MINGVNYIGRRFMVKNKMGIVGLCVDVEGDKNFIIATKGGNMKFNAEDLIELVNIKNR